DNVVAFKDTVATGRLFHSRQLLYSQRADPTTVRGVSGDQIIVSDYPMAPWHTGMAALLAPEFVAFHRAVVHHRTDEAALWSATLAPLMQLMGYERPLSALYALAEVCGVRTGAPRRPLLPIPTRSKRLLADAVEQLRAATPHIAD
ncbi:MAG: dihydrodipicolinate synthase family protein, partial [Kocuria sp.]|nr:dihydrodipicolinate synthase family protein [Kocuria sp.]